MRSDELALDRYDTDKILEWYDPIFAPLVDRDVRLLEIGIHRGGSLRLWRDYFPNGRIVGIDLELPAALDGEERIRAFRGDQRDVSFLTEVARETAPEGFDVIIDDASHLGEATKITFWHLFDNHLRPGGLYVIEDWGTGYWDDWPDGAALRPRSTRSWLRSKRDAVFRGFGLAQKTPWPAHSYGMVGLVKELVDEQGAADVLRARSMGTAARESKLDSMVIRPSVVFLRKRA